MGKASRRKYQQRAQFAPMTAREAMLDAVHYWTKMEAYMGNQIRHAVDNSILDLLGVDRGVLDVTGFNLKTKADKRFGNVPVYKTNTKQIGEIMCAQGTQVPGIDVWYRPGVKDLVLVAWCRKHRIADIQHAVAFLIMLDKKPVVVRAFEP